MQTRMILQQHTVLHMWLKQQYVDMTYSSDVDSGQDDEWWRHLGTHFTLHCWTELVD